MAEAKEPKRGNPAMVEGAPSLNPAGRGATKAAKPESTAAPGTTGVVSYGGIIQSGEGNSALVGRQKWVTYGNAMNLAIVATGIRYFGNLLADTEWHAEPNPAGGKLAQRGVEIVNQGLLRSPMPRSWPLIVRKAAMYKFLGFSLHATGIMRRADGLICFSDIAHRPQHTIEKWLRDDETQPFRTVEQRSPETHKLYPIELAECFYCVDDLLSDSPEGVGLLRHVIELVRRLGLFEGLEGSGYFQEIGGLPIARAPLEEIAAAAGTGDMVKVKAAIADATANIQAAVANRVRTPEKLQWLMLDSSTFKGSDTNTISPVQKWGIEVLKSEFQNADKLNKTIQRVGLEIARVLGIEFAMVGGGDSAGSYGMHEDKTSMFESNLSTTLSEIGLFADRQLCRRLIALNGLDPDTCTPTLVCEPISTDAIESVTRALANMAIAGLQLNDPARNVLRKRMKLPPEPELDEASLMIQRPRPGRKQPGGNEPKDPNPVDDKTRDNAKERAA